MSNTIMIAYYLGRRKENERTSLFDQLVCFATSSKYSHLEYVYDYSPVTGLAVCWSSSPRDGGVRRKVIHLDPQTWELYSVKSEISITGILSWFYANEGVKYDWFGAFATKLPFVKQSSTRIFCSEAIATILGMPKPHKETPQSIYNVLASNSTRIPL